MNLDSVTVGHVITVDFGPDRRSPVRRVWDWLQFKEPDYGIRCFSFSTMHNHLQREKELPDLDTDGGDDFGLADGYMNTVAGWFCLVLALALFFAIDLYAGG
jgi:hypothetical protein